MDFWMKIIHFTVLSLIIVIGLFGTWTICRPLSDRDSDTPFLILRLIITLFLLTLWFSIGMWSYHL